MCHIPSLTYLQPEYFVSMHRWFLFLVKIYNSVACILKKTSSAKKRKCQNSLTVEKRPSSKAQLWDIMGAE